MAERASLAGLRSFRRRKAKIRRRRQTRGREMSAKVRQHKKTVLRATNTRVLDSACDEPIHRGGYDTWTRDALNGDSSLAANWRQPYRSKLLAQGRI